MALPNYPGQSALIQSLSAKDPNLFTYLTTLDKFSQGVSNSLANQVFMRTLLIKDTTVGNNIADVIAVQGSGIGQSVIGVLRKAIASALTVRINLNGSPLIICSIPAVQPIFTPQTFLSFTAGSSEQVINTGSALSADVTASDGSKDAAGIASFTLLWS